MGYHWHMNEPTTKIPRFNEIQDMVKAAYPDADVGLIQSAYIYSAKAHGGQTRRSGEPYLVHPVAVAKILAQMRLDEASVATGLLHDIVEDTLTSAEELAEFFGDEIAQLVDGVTKISKMAFQSKEERQAESFRKMILAMSRDIRVLLVKLADRLHNMRTLNFMPPEAQKRIAQETLDIYAPLAARLGIYWMRTELEDLSFLYLEPEGYTSIKVNLEESIKRTADYVNNVLRIVRERLESKSIAGSVKGRNKDIFSIHRKMKAQGLEFDQIHDLTAFRIVVDSVGDCYAVLGIIHDLWKPVHQRFKDYIAMPKSNGYQSLHTTVIGPEGGRIEIQIRTQEMDVIAENGIAAHWSYKEGKIAQPDDIKLTNWLRQMMEWQQDVNDPREFLESVRIDLYPDDIYVFTPKGEVKEFPKNSTPLDFAYAIHTEVGHRCVGARINGRIVPLRHPMSTGDTVEIVTSAHGKPSKDWLKSVKTSRAKTKIRHFILAEERTRSIQIGRETTDRELRKWRMDLLRAERDGEILKIAKEFSFKTETDLYAAIGYGRVSPKQVITVLVPPQDREKARSELTQEREEKKHRGSSKSGVKIEGMADMMVNFAKCCSPLPGDSITGFITRGRGITIHKADCVNLNSLDDRRLVSAQWDEQQAFNWIVSIEVQAKNRNHLLADLSGVFSSNGSAIAKVNAQSLNEHNAQGIFMVYVKNLDHLTRLINALKKVKGVHKVERLGAVHTIK
jgi:GTP diphosphokinase / guanosine-3',5'-bis(diphosphate) 3'-diphosphatase